jgi:gluconokinase
VNISHLVSNPASPPSLHTASRLRHKIVIMGVSGSGKTTVGQALAQHLGILFRDGDDFHPAANIKKMRAGVALNDNDRWGWLELISNSLRRDAPVIIACSALRAAYRDHIRAGTGGDVVFVYLAGAPDVIGARVAERTHAFMAPTLLDSQFEALEPPSADEAIILPVTLPVAAQIDIITATLAAR